MKHNTNVWLTSRLGSARLGAVRCLQSFCHGIFFFFFFRCWIFCFAPQNDDSVQVQICYSERETRRQKIFFSRFHYIIAVQKMRNTSMVGSSLHSRENVAFVFDLKSENSTTKNNNNNKNNNNIIKLNTYV